MKIFLEKNKWLVGIIIASVIFRILASFYMGDNVVDLPGTFDQISYHNLALRVLSGHGFSFGETWWPITPADAPTAHWSFLYTLYLVILYSLFGVHPLVARLIQAIIVGLLQPFLAYLIGAKLFSKTVGLVSAGLTVIYAYFIYYDATLMTEPFFITLVLVSLYLTILLAQAPTNNKEYFSNRQSLIFSICLGIALGEAVLLRQLILLIIPFLFLWIWWVRRKQSIRNTLSYLFSITLIIFLMIIPFTIYNTNRFGHFVFLNTNSGYAFYWANHPIYGTHFQSILKTGSYQDLIPNELRNLDEAELDQALLKRGLQFVIDDPVRYVLLSISRIPEYFKFWPSADSGLISNVSRVASFGILWPFMLYGIYLAVAGQKKKLSEWFESPIALLLLFVSVYTIIHLLSWSLIRYRLPIDAVLLIFASLAVVDIANRVIRRLRSSRNLTKIQNNSL